MIIELYGLPAAGKTTLARAYAQDGAILVRAPKGPRLAVEGALFFVMHPIRALGQLWFLARYASASLRYMLFVNLFLAHGAKWLRAEAHSRAGRVAVIDQGHHQNLLSLFSSLPSEKTLRRYCAFLPEPDLLLVVDAPADERMRRLQQRPELTEEVKERRDVAQQIFETTVRVLKGIRFVDAVNTAEEASLASLLRRRVTYATIARMPTEKAHGISIAHLCTALANLGSRVNLVIPSRRTTISASVADYYGVQDNFGVTRVRTPDFVGKGLTHPVFFFLQRILFLIALKRRGIDPGVLYTREPEIAWAFSSSHFAVFEVHRWPRGVAGLLTAALLRRVSLVVCNSSGTEAAVRKAGLHRTLVAPNGFDAAAFNRAEPKQASRKRLGLAQDVPVALYVGLLAKGKGVRTLFEAAHLLAPKVQVVVIGGGEEEVRELKQEYPDVAFLGYRPYTELADNLAAADVLVLPNTRADSESTIYTSPIKLFSYMAAGIPIVASRVPSVLEVLTESEAWFVEPDSPEALAEGVENCLNDTDLSRRKASRARLTAAGYTWENRGTRIHNRLGTIV